MTSTPPSKNTSIRRSLLLSACVAGILAPLPSTAATSPGVDEHTVALWLFDEPMYPNVILTDASRYRHDLRLTSPYGDWAVRTESKGEPPTKPLHVEGRYGLVDGKFGRALHVPDPAQARVIWPDQRQRYSSESMIGTFKDVPERFNIGYYDWTIEFWFKARGEQSTSGTIYVVRNEQDYPRGLPMENALRISTRRRSFALISHTTMDTTADLGAPSTTWNLEVTIPTDSTRLNDGDWHHIAFTYVAEERQLRHWVDGRLQPRPEKGGFLPMLGVIKEVSVGGNVAGVLDEYRLSDTARYTGSSFKTPASFSFSHQAEPRPENKPNGPVPLFASNRDPSAPLPLGSRKHVLIDGAIIDTQSNIAFRPQPPQLRETTDFKNTHAWEPTPRLGSTIPDITTIWDEGDELRMIYTNTGMWGGKKHVHAIATSTDGLHWTKPTFGLHSWEGERDTNIVLDVAGQGALIKDANPTAAPDERYKMLLWSYYHGYYVWTSPDGVHFERNETVGFPLDTDGSTTFFWDDQRGVYQAYFRAVSESAATRRRVGHAVIENLLQPWPFRPVEWPWIDDLVLGRPSRGEIDILDTGGQVYRFKAHKYEWAPDTYIAFPWRYVYETNVRPGSFLMVSRDGANWTRYEDPYYFPGGWKFGGRDVLEALMEHGIIRRGDTLWQFGTVRFTEHGGALYGGQEFDGGIHDRLLRLTQRLDGFVAVTPADATAGAGSFTTKPFVFDGSTLEMNIDASGGVARIELQDAAGNPIPGFTQADSTPIRVDDTAVTAAWTSGSSVASLAGKAVRLHIELNGAKLYAFQFR